MSTHSSYFCDGARRQDEACGCGETDGAFPGAARYLHPEWKEQAAAVMALPVPANFTTVLGMWAGAPESDEGQVQVPQEVVMVGPWGLEPQTSTVSR